MKSPDLVLDPAPSAIEPSKSNQWYKDAIIYQLHLKSFFDANNDGIGDFEGLISKLDYIVELGCDTVWLLPFYPSPRRDDGYDIASYRDVHSDYGKLADVKRFVSEAHRRGLRVITELVINHTSDQHPWFQRARRAKPGSNARNYYVWSDTNQKYSGTRIIFCDTETSNWTWDPVAGAYFWHRFYSHQPDLNFDHPPVMREVLAVMKFWLEMGVDGLRLDAVPYLIEREGTTNENLPETHVLLKQIRAALDATFPGRMLLAEANMWPEQVQEYFGNDPQGMGNECHMAFHFPLMPRMYMAIAREDRHPITDILRQTPEIPANCQWAIFLRNHDELTLEMVTSRERDYLWQTYASDARARLNLGIRRRLSPLMERDRRRIELMNSLLLSMPGTPVIYYGDEIGMGDNLHLGDRDGVRTPMQWSPDRNGGFSRADPEVMVLPPIRSAMYGYEAVNVETQTKDPHSLLNWTRRMLALRRQHRAFGRGTIQMLNPGNRRIFAYLRMDNNETILCVANLARSTQAVELDLAAYAGRVPVELLGGSTFPTIGQLPYLLTLPPHGFYWFELSANAQPPDWHTLDGLATPELLTLVLGNRVGYELTATSRAALEREVLPGYLARRRWVEGFEPDQTPVVQIHYAAPIPGGDELFIAEVSVAPAHGPHEGDAPEARLRDHHAHPTTLHADADDLHDDEGEPRYQLPVTILWDEEDSTGGLPQQLAMARVRRGARIGLLTDAFTLERFARSIVKAMRAGASIASPLGTLSFHGHSGIEDPLLDEAPIRWFSLEKPNGSLWIEGAAILTLIRRVKAGVHPEVEMTHYLSHHGYRNASMLLGEVVRHDPAGVPHTLMLLQRAISNEGDGWNWLLNAFTRTLEDAALTGSSEVEYRDQLEAAETIVGAIGRRLAELHAVLASSGALARAQAAAEDRAQAAATAEGMPHEDAAAEPATDASSDPAGAPASELAAASGQSSPESPAPYDAAAFAPRSVGRDEIDAWAGATRDRLESALRAIERTTEWRSEVAQEAARYLLSQQQALLAWPDELAQRVQQATITRTHGHFHLAQTLISGDDVYLIGFDGDPALPPAQRRQLDHPLRDVAGLLRSIDHAVQTARQSGEEKAAGSATRSRRDQLLDSFHQVLAEVFLHAYFDTRRELADGPGDPLRGDACDAALLELFQLDRVAREIEYEAVNRPMLVETPLRGLAALMRRHSEQPDALLTTLQQAGGAN